MSLSDCGAADHGGPVDELAAAPKPAAGAAGEAKAVNPSSQEEPPWLARADEKGWSWARIAWSRAAATPDAWYDAAKADAVVKLWPEWFRLTDDRFAGVPFHLTFWQEIVVRLLVGWKRPVEVIDPRTGRQAFEHVRLFRRLDLWIPRKNGKSEFLAALALLFWAIEGAYRGQGFCFARDEKQAAIVLSKMAAMVALQPQLTKAITAQKKSLFLAERGALFEVLSGRAEGKHGRSPSVIVGDEMHEWTSTDLSTNLRQGTGARLQPIELYASTAGLKSARTGWRLFEEGQAILDGRIDDASTLVVMFCANEDDDWRDEAVWRRVNPNIGLSPAIDMLRREAAKAAQSPRAESEFRRYHLNQWVEAISRWLPLKNWRACGASGGWKEAHEKLRGRRCYGGVDVSSNTDVTALVWWFPPSDDDPKTRVACQFWVPAENMDVRSKRDRVPYENWATMGALVATPGNHVDQTYVQAAIKEGLEWFDVAKIGVDPWNATKLITDLQSDGVSADRIVKVRQGIYSLGAASKEFELLVLAETFDYGGHPVMEWMGRNALIRFDRNMNFMPDKQQSREKIDGVVAAIIAEAVAIGEPKPVPSVYAKRGALIL